MEVCADLTYTELRARLAMSLGRSEVPTSTLSRWMADLSYPKGQPGKRRRWNQEDLIYLASYGQGLSWGYGVEESQEYAKRQLRKFRESNYARH